MMQFLRECAPGANAWIEANFHDCIYTPREAISFGLGLASIVVWILAQMPQFIDNIKNESAEALSIWFLAQVEDVSFSRTSKPVCMGGTNPNQPVLKLNTPPASP